MYNTSHKHNTTSYYKNFFQDSNPTHRMLSYLWFSDINYKGETKLYACIHVWEKKNNVVFSSFFFKLVHKKYIFFLHYALWGQLTISVRVDKQGILFRSNLV